MFKFKKIKSVRWPVSVPVPVDGGKTEAAEFEAEFLYLDEPSLQRLLIDSAGNNKEQLRKVVVGWNGLLDENDEPLPFSQDNLEVVTDYPYIALAMIEAFGAMQRGAAAKN